LSVIIKIEQLFSHFPKFIKSLNFEIMAEKTWSYSRGTLFGEFGI